MKAYAIMWNGAINKDRSGWLDIYDNKKVAKQVSFDGEEVVEIEIIIKDKVNEK